MIDVGKRSFYTGLLIMMCALDITIFTATEGVLGGAGGVLMMIVMQI
jgi:hypothetical protein